MRSWRSAATLAGRVLIHARLALRRSRKNRSRGAVGAAVAHAHRVRLVHRVDHLLAHQEDDGKQRDVASPNIVIVNALTYPPMPSPG